jgi:hypothetical protein
VNRAAHAAVESIPDATHHLSVTQEIRRAGVIVLESHLVFECAFCGQSVVRTSHAKARAVLDPHGGTGLATCPKCGNTCVLTLKGTGLDNGARDSA